MPRPIDILEEAGWKRKQVRLDHNYASYVNPLYECNVFAVWSSNIHLPEYPNPEDGICLTVTSLRDERYAAPLTVSEARLIASDILYLLKGG